MAAVKLSVGMPVFNGAALVENAISTVLSQSFSDLELVISDNGSTDDTEAICRRRAATDSRVKYVRQDRNCGALANFEFVLAQASGEFFQWAAHDDKWHPDFAKSAIAALEARPDAALAMGRVRYVGLDGTEVRAPDAPPYHCDVPLQADRLRSYFVNGPTDTLIYGVFRRSALVDAPFVPSMCSEKMILAHALLRGPVLDVEGMEYTCLLVPKDRNTVAAMAGLEPGHHGDEAVYHEMVRVLRGGLTLTEFIRVYPAFVFHNNWHKFFAKKALRRIRLRH